MASRVDLHTHTTASDGTMAPLALWNKASELGVEVLSVTDHDSTEGYQAIIAAMATAPVPEKPAPRLIPGIEVNVEGEFACHLLGYFIRPEDERLQERLRGLRLQRIERLRAMANRLAKMGFPIDFEAVLAKNGASVGRPHLADALVENKVVKSRNEAFRRFLKKDGPAYEATASPTLDESISLIRDAGGIPVLAHPSYYTSENFLRSLADRGLMGIEAYYPEHSRSLTANYVRWAESLGLLVTGGSDFHGPKTGRDALATVSVPWEVVTALDARHHQGIPDR